MRRICLICQKEFNTIPAHIRKGEGKYCSKTCYWEARWGAKRKEPRVCLHCGQRFETFPCEHHKFCSHNCASSYRKGKPLPAKERKLIKQCEWCGKEFSRPQSDFHAKHYFCCHNCNALWWAEFGLHGKEHPRWSGGCATPYGIGWKSAREEAFKRANGICELCHKNPVKEVHHLLPVILFSHISETHFKSNLKALCRSCHSKEHRRLKTALPLLMLIPLSNNNS